MVGRDEGRGNRAVPPAWVGIAITMRGPNGTALALGIVTTGSSVGALVLSPALQVVIDAWDWRTNQDDCCRYDDRRLGSDHD